MTAEEFYALRDDRTNACIGEPVHVRSSVSISIDDSAAGTYSGQVAFLLTVNLTARWCRRMRVTAPDVAVDSRLRWLISGDERLARLAIDIARAADPFGDFAAGSPRDGNWLELHVGSRRAPKGAYRINGAGWLALGGDSVFDAELRDDNALGAALAGCIGAAWAFRAAIGDTSFPSSVRLSLWNLEGGSDALRGPPTTVAELGLVALIGSGAVGSSIAYLLPLIGAQGRVSLVDKDPVDFTNLNRSPLFFFEDFGRRKCDVTASYLQRTGLGAEPLPMWFDEAVSRGLIFKERPDLVIPTANEYGVRHSIQHQVPPIQVYGTTGRNWQAFLGRHIPLREDCLACRFPVGRPAMPPLACATGSIELPGAVATVDAALPFLSTAAAILATAELVKATTIGFPLNPNFACLDFRGPLTDFLVVQNATTPSCLCKSQIAVWERINGRTRFAGASR